MSSDGTQKPDDATGSPEIPPSAPGRLAHRLAFQSKVSNAKSASYSRTQRGELPLAPTARVLRHLSESAEKDYSAKRLGGILEKAAFLIETSYLFIAAKRWFEYRLVASQHPPVSALGRYRRGLSYATRVLRARRAASASKL